MHRERERNEPGGREEREIIESVVGAGAAPLSVRDVARSYWLAARGRGQQCVGVGETQRWCGEAVSRVLSGVLCE